MSKGPYPNQIQAEAIYAAREARVNALASKGNITVEDLEDLDYNGRCRVCNELWAICDDQARKSLKNDSHHFVRSCASVAMATKVQNGFIANMAKQLVAGINAGHPFVEVYLDSMDCSIEAEVHNLNHLQHAIATHPYRQPHLSFDVIRKWLYGWKEADKALACMHLKPSKAWAKEYYESYRPESFRSERAQTTDQVATQD